VLTRRLQTSLVIADALVAKLEGRGTEEVETLLSQLRDRGDHMLRGRSTPVRIWTKAE
jgi:class 3 adenylate cyclase